MKTAIYPGSFDPCTNGHLDIIRRAARLFDHVSIAVLTNPAKHPLLAPGLRVDLLRGCVSDVENVSVDLFAGLLVEFAQKQGARYVVRGLRDAGDVSSEMRMAHMNRTLWPEIDTVFLATAPELSFVSSSLVRDIIRHGGDIVPFVPPFVVAALARQGR